MRTLIVLLILAATFDLSLVRPWRARRRCANRPRKNLRASVTKLGDRFRKTQAAMDAEPIARESRELIVSSRAKTMRKTVSRRYPVVPGPPAL